MRSLLFLLGSSLSLFGQPTTVTGTVTAPTGDRADGRCVIRAEIPFRAASGTYVFGLPVFAPISNGALSVGLIPTDTGTPSNACYRMVCSIPQQVRNSHVVGPYTWGPVYFYVPTGAPVDISSVEITPNPNARNPCSGTRSACRSMTGIPWTSLVGTTWPQLAGACW